MAVFTCKLSGLAAIVAYTHLGPHSLGSYIVKLLYIIYIYLSAIRAMHIAHGLETAPFKDERLPLFLKAIRIHRPFQPRVLAHLDISLLEKIIHLCDHMQFSQVFKPLYLLMFFSFLRISNVLPHAVNQFDFTRHLARGDVISGATGAVLLIKWSKTLQNRRDFVTI